MGSPCSTPRRCTRAGASERRLGELARGRDDVVIATKFPPGWRARPKDLPHALAASLQHLQRDRVDLLQHHFPARTMPIAELMGAMAAAAAAGQVRAVGVSNYSAQQLRQAHRVLADAGVPLASNQVQYSLLHRNPETDGVLDTCRQLRVTLIAYQALAAGALTGKYGPDHKPKGLRRMTPPFRGGGLKRLPPVVAVLREIGARHDATPGQVALRWLIENPLVLPIPGAKNGAQATANAKALAFTLEPAEVAELDAATAAWRG